MNVKKHAIYFLFFLLLGQKSFSQVFIPFAFWNNCKQTQNSGTDQSLADFSGGTFSNTMTVGNSVTLSPAQVSGTYTSRVFEVFCGALFNWYSFSWKTTLPFEKELTSTSETTANYSATVANLMNSLLVYYNFNETAANSATSGNDFEDRSGNGRHATESNLSAYGVSGRFLQAARLNGTNSTIAPSSLSSTAKNYTFSMWFKTTASSGTLTYLFDTLDGANRIIIAPTCSSALCSTAGRIGVCAGSCASLTSTTINSPTDGNWHHLAVTTNTTTGNIKVYLDYTSTYTYATYGAGYNINASNRIGSRYDGSNWRYNGDIDEFAIWARTLSDAEVLQLYIRGANRLRFQFRSCTSSTCADNPTWRGPGGTAATFFSELHNNTNQSAQNGNALTTYPILLFSNFTSLGLPTDKYFQYQVTFQTDNVLYIPDMTFGQIVR